MIVHFDDKSLTLQVKVGTLETYKPSKEMKALQKKVDKLREKVLAFKKEKLEPEVQEIMQMIGELNKPFIEGKKE